MAKETGLGDNCYVDGVDISGDVGSLGNIGCPQETLDVTGIDKLAFERLGGRRDGAIEFSAFFNKDSFREHAILSTLPRTDRILTYCRGTTLGNPAACMVAKQLNYDPTRGDDGALTIAVSAQANAYGIEWGEQLTAGSDNMTSAAAGTSVDYGAAVGTTNFGLQAYLQVFTITGTSATVAIQSSTDNAATDAFTNVTGAVFTAATALGAERIATGPTAAVERYLRVNVTGTFSNLDFAVVVVRNLAATVF